MKIKSNLTKITLMISTILILICLHYTTGYSTKINNEQSENDTALHSVKKLEVGDFLPINNLNFHHTKNYPKKSISLTDFKNKKLIILDFWSKHCSVCIASMPKIQELQEKFADKIQFIFVTYNSKEELSNLFQKSMNLKRNTLPMIFSDTLLSTKFFPHSGNPYYVWLDHNGKVLSKTIYSEVTEKNIANFIKDNNTTIQKTNDENKMGPDGLNSDDPNNSILTAENGNLKKNIIYYNSIPKTNTTNASFSIKERYTTQKNLSAFSSDQYSLFMAGLPNYSLIGKSIAYIKNAKGEEIGMRILQVPLTTIMAIAYSDIIKQTNTTRKIITNGALKYFEGLSDTTNITRFNSEKNYTYEIIMNNFSKESAKNILKLDIARCFGLTATVKKESIMCLILETKDTLSPNPTKNSDTEIDEVLTNSRRTSFSNSTIGFITAYLDRKLRSQKILVINETKIPPDYKFDLNIHTSSLKSLDTTAIKNEMKMGGIQCKFEKREFNAFVISNAY